MAVWVKSARSTAEGDNCVEAMAVFDGVMVRNSKLPDGPIIRYSKAEWDAFLDGVKKEEFAWERLWEMGYGLGDTTASQAV